MEELKIEIDAPWTNGPQEYVGMLAFLGQAREQLLFFQKEKNTEHIRNDIEGYELILKSGQEANANRFLELKQNALRVGNRFENNLAVIDIMKKDGSWLE